MFHHQWQRAFVLHRQAYSETSLLVDLFTEQQGRVRVLAKGARRPKSVWRGILQPFTPLLVRFSGKAGLKTLSKGEAVSLTLPFSGNVLYSGFYINELLMRLLEENTAYPALFDNYLKCLMALAATPEYLEENLRQFEFFLLKELGYAVDFEHCAGSGEPVSPTMTYRYTPQQGFIATLVKSHQTFYGRELLDFYRQDFSSIETKQAAKRFIRLILKEYLGSKPLKSRELFSKSVLENKQLKIY